MKKKRVVFVLSSLVFFILTIPVLTTAGTAEEEVQDCKICHTGYYMVDRHHMLSAPVGTPGGGGLDCLYCHQLTWNPETSAYNLSQDKNICFVQCHANGFYRDSARMFDRVTLEVLNNNGWDYGGAGSNKVKDQHHSNYGFEDYSSFNCATCHESFWNPDPGFWDSRFLAGSAHEETIYHSDGTPDGTGTLAANDGENVNIVVTNDQLLYDLYKAGGVYSIHVDASATEGNIATVKWSITNQEITAAANNLIFDYDFQWMYAGDTAVVKLEVWDTTGRYQKQNIAVNFR